MEYGLEMSLGDGKWFSNTWAPAEENCTCPRQDKRQIYKPNIQMDKQVNLVFLCRINKQWYKSMSKW